MRIDDHNLVLVNEVQITAPFRLNAHEGLWHGDDVHIASVNDRPDPHVKVDMPHPRCTMGIDDFLADRGTLLIIEVDVSTPGSAC